MNQYQFSAPPLSKTNKIILIISAVVFLITSVTKAVGAFSVPQILGLSGAGLMSGLIFQIFTYPFVEVGLMSFIFNGLVVWFIGSELESQWGQRVYLRFLLINVLGVAILASSINILLLFGTAAYLTPLFGLTGVNFSLLIAYAMIYPDRQMSMMMIFPMKAKTFCWILVGIEAYMALINNYTAAWAHLLAMGISYLIIHFQTAPLVKKALNSTFESKKRSKSHLYVVKDEEQKPPKFWQ
jgi:membrane associated rhomboid family serine protease